MRSLLALFILPLSLIYLTVALATFFVLRKKKKGAAITLSLAFLLFLLFTTPFFPNQLARSLQNQSVPLLQIPDTLNPRYILVLGGGHINDQRLPSTGQLSLRALGRLTEAIRLLHLLDEHRIATSDTTLHPVQIVVSGYSGSQPLPQAVVLKQAAIQLNIDSARLLLQSSPVNTQAEAEAFFARVGKRTPFILVTDAIHMPRALYLFRRLGMKPVPAPTNYFAKEDSWPDPLWWAPNSRHIEASEAALHEYIGLFIARFE